MGVAAGPSVGGWELIVASGPASFITTIDLDFASAEDSVTHAIHDRDLSTTTARDSDTARRECRPELADPEERRSRDRAVSGDVREEHSYVQPRLGQQRHHARLIHGCP